MSIRTFFAFFVIFCFITEFFVLEKIFSYERDWNDYGINIAAYLSLIILIPLAINFILAILKPIKFKNKLIEKKMIILSFFGLLTVWGAWELYGHITIVLLVIAGLLQSFTTVIYFLNIDKRNISTY